MYRGFNSHRHEFQVLILILDDVAAASRTVNAFALVRIQVEEFSFVQGVWGCGVVVNMSLCRREDRGFDPRQPRQET